MANLGKVLKEEIVRLSRKNDSALSKPLKNELRAIKKQVRSLAAAVKSLQAALGKVAPAAVAESAGEGEEGGKVRGITGKGVKSLRKKLKLTQAELAKLAKVSAQAVVMWERRSGKLRLRKATQQALNGVRAMSKADVKAALGR